MLLRKLAFKNCPNDKNLRNLIQGRLLYCFKDEEFLLMGRYFNKVSDDYKQKLETNKEYCDSMASMNEIQEELKCILIKFSGENSSRDLGNNIIQMQFYLEDKWLSGEQEFVRESLEKVISAFPNNIEFVLMKAQIETKKGDLENAEKTYRNAIKSVINSSKKIHLIVRLSELQRNRGLFFEPRYVLDYAKSEFPFHVEPWIASIRLEILANKKINAKIFLVQAMIKFPASGELLAQSISMEKASNKGKKSAEALQICVKDEYDKEASYVMLATAKMLMLNKGKLNKSRKWLNKTVERYPYFADAWAYFYKIEKIFGSDESAREVLLRFLELTESEYCFIIKHHYYLWGREWVTFTSQIDNWGLTREELLEAFADALDVGRII